jgi:hypothetical protein
VIVAGTLSIRCHHNDVESLKIAGRVKGWDQRRPSRPLGDLVFVVDGGVPEFDIQAQAIEEVSGVEELATGQSERVKEK